MSEVLVSDDPEPSPANQAPALENAPCNHILSARETIEYARSIKSHLGEVAIFVVNNWFEIEDDHASSTDWRHVQSVYGAHNSIQGEVIDYVKAEVVYISDDYSAAVPGAIVDQSGKLVFLPAEDTAKITPQ